ncbi:MAG: hypothetical protein PHR32_07080, partial [Candidatus Cloacimonetes bacterium]|nr:hypothetical protein [Candidatus Cloacimonadota bacterium]
MKTKLNTYYPYLLGLFILHGLILVIIGVVRCDYWGDYIHHVGAIRELALHPLHPVHPQLGINAMTPFFTPYHFFVAMLQRITNIDTYKLLSYFGILNYLFLMASICLFVKKLFKSKMAVLLYVFFMLYLWGFPTLDFSGFTHLKVIGSVASYHSTLSNAMVYLTLYLFMKYVETKKIIYLPMQALSIALCVIPNPVNAPVMYVAYVLLVATYSFYNSWDKKILITGGLVVFVSLALWALWPYASLIEIIRARGMSQTLWPRSGFSNMKSIFGALLPTIVGVSILMPLNTKNKENTWIYLSFIAFLMIY